MVQKQEKGNLDGARNATKRRAKRVCVYIHARVCRLCDFCGFAFYNFLVDTL